MHQQRRLLGAALERVRPGGVGAYVTCSPLRLETVDVVSSVMGRGAAAVEQLDARSALPAGIPELSGPGVQLWPHLHDTDAMFLALLRRSSDG